MMPSNMVVGILDDVARGGARKLVYCVLVLYEFKAFVGRPYKKKGGSLRNRFDVDS